MLNQGHPRQKSTDYDLLRFDSSCDKATPKKYSHRVCFSKKEGRKAPIPLFFPPNTWKAQFLTNDLLKGCFHLMSVDLNTSVPNCNFRILPSPHPSQKQHLFVLLWLYRFDAQSHDVSSFHLPALVLLHSRPLHHYLIARRFAAQTWQSHKLNSVKVINPWPR